MLLVATGQQALSDVQDLQKLLGRFAVQVALGEADIDTVIRKTVLRKKPGADIAWVGAPPPLPKGEFVALADGNKGLEPGLSALHDLFFHAPILGTLIQPTGGDLASPTRIGRIEELLEPLLSMGAPAPR